MKAHSRAGNTADRQVMIDRRTGISQIESPYLHVFDHLDCVLHRIEEAGVAEIMEGMHYQQIRETEKILPNGKKLVRMDFRRTVV